MERRENEKGGMPQEPHDSRRGHEGKKPCDRHALIKASRGIQGSSGRSSADHGIITLMWGRGAACLNHSEACLVDVCASPR